MYAPFALQPLMPATVRFAAAVMVAALLACVAAGASSASRHAVLSAQEALTHDASYATLPAVQVVVKRPQTGAPA